MDSFASFPMIQTAKNYACISAIVCYYLKKKKIRHKPDPQVKSPSAYSLVVIRNYYNVASFTGMSRAFLKKTGKKVENHNAGIGKESPDSNIAHYQRTSNHN